MFRDGLSADSCQAVTDTDEEAAEMAADEIALWKLRANPPPGR